MTVLSRRITFSACSSVNQAEAIRYRTYEMCYSINIVSVDSQKGHGCVRPSVNDTLQSLQLSACLDVDSQSGQIFHSVLKNFSQFWHLYVPFLGLRRGLDS